MGRVGGNQRLKIENSKFRVKDFEDRIRLSFPRVCCQLRDRAAEQRMHPVRRHLRRWSEGKRALVQARVRKLQRRPSAHQTLCEEEVEIQHSWSPPFLLRPISAGGPFELLTARVEIMRPRRPLDHHRCVDVVGLGRTDWPGAPQPRYGHNPPIHRKRGQTIRKQLLRVTNIAAEAENDAKHQPG